jgi:2-oxoglutarate dehydrogenase E2 component (dihydrolipoamide succinyltransferase)
MPIELKVPEFGESVKEVHIGEWRKAVGDRVEADEPLVEAESEKATFDIPAPVAGVLSRIVKQSGETAQVGEAIAYIDETAGANAPSAETKTRGQQLQVAKEARPRAKRAEVEEKSREAAATRSQPEQKPASAARAEREAPPRVMPSARRALAQHGLSAEDVEGTGPGGRLLKEDVERHIAAAEPDRELERESAPPERAEGREEVIVPMSPIRRRIAERLVRAQQTAALLTTFNEVDMTAVQQIRSLHQDQFRERHGIKLGLMSFFVKATIDALKLEPKVNAEVRGTDIVYRDYYDIGIAVSTERGLVVPVLRDAERLSFADIEKAIDAFGRRARESSLTVEDLTGGTFTITNGGIFGSLLSTPIVNLPQSGVLGLHAIQERPVVRDGAIVARPMMYVALTYDHRIVDGREAVTFLRRIKEAVEEPARMLVEV